jgi:hypothetical protein
LTEPSRPAGEIGRPRVPVQEGRRESRSCDGRRTAWGGAGSNGAVVTGRVSVEQALARGVPEGYDATRRALHAVAAHVITPARYRATGRIGLRATAGGFGTPPFEVDGRVLRVRVGGTHLFVQGQGLLERAPLSTLGAAARLVLGRDEGDLTWADDLHVRDRPADVDPSAPLAIDPAAADLVAAWLALGDEVLGALHADGFDTSEPQLWPEHFDLAVEALPEPRRASYGCSPGDDAHPEPYAYVSVWSPDAVGGLDDPNWTATAFPGALVGLAEVAAQADPAAWLLGWFRAHRDHLAGPVAQR